MIGVKALDYWSIVKFILDYTMVAVVVTAMVAVVVTAMVAVVTAMD